MLYLFRSSITASILIIHSLLQLHLDTHDLANELIIRNHYLGSEFNHRPLSTALGFSTWSPRNSYILWISMCGSQLALFTEKTRTEGWPSAYIEAMKGRISILEKTHHEVRHVLSLQIHSHIFI